MTVSVAELIERLEKAEGANFALDNAIGEVFEPERTEHGLNHRCYTGSLDAAMDLLAKVLPDAQLLIGFKQTAATKPWARVGNWSASDATGKTPALALCTAILKSIQDSRP